MTVSLPIEFFAQMTKVVFPEDLPTLADLEQRFPPRMLPANAMVTRVGPSPTGFVHIGTLYAGLLSERFAHQSEGVFFLRIEDTDKKREVAGAADFIFEAFDYFDIPYDEGQKLGGAEVGGYGPYTQSHRAPIYQAYVKHLLEIGLAYPCFCTTEELAEIRRVQEARSLRPGYYGKWAVWRDKSAEEVTEALGAGLPYVIRFRSKGSDARRIAFDDIIFGERTMPENDQDIVIMKADRLPTYHLAHVVDDHLMGTTHVIRGDEWLASVPIHLQLFEAFGWKPPAYAHIAPINKIDGKSKRKLSKRKDPEAGVGYFINLGYPKEALIEYMLNLANSNFEGWRRDNPEADYRSFEVSFEKLRNSAGPLFDFVKLDSISRDVITRFTTQELRARVVEWAKAHDAEFAAMLESDPEYAFRILDIERHGPKARKDVSKWSQVRAESDFFFDAWFRLSLEDAISLIGSLPVEEVQGIVAAFLESYSSADAQEAWFDKIKSIATARGFAEKGSDYKKNPEAYKGTVADVAKVLRVLLTGRAQSPDLHAIMQAMGDDRVRARLSLAKGGG